MSTGPSKRTRPKITIRRAFKISNVLLLEEQEQMVASGRRRAILKNRARRFDAMITPSKKRKAIEDHRPTVAKCLEDIRAQGAPVNHAQFIRKLRHEAAFEATRTLKSSTGRSLAGTRADKARPVSDTTARSILQRAFRLKGKRGKKRSSSNS
jgi:hypothetical protein